MEFNIVAPYMDMFGINRIYVKDYADVKFGCVPVAQPKTCHYRPRELPGIHTPLYSGGKLWVAQPRHPGFFGLRNV